MESRRKREPAHTIFATIAALLALSVVTLAPSVALADPRSPDAPSADGSKPHPAKPAKKKHPKKTRAAKAKKQGAGHDKSDARAKAGGAKSDAKSKKKAKKPKKTASRSLSGAKHAKKKGKKADPEAPRRPCLGAPISLDRSGLEGQRLRLVDCHDRPLDVADRALSVLARPWGAPKPATGTPRRGKTPMRPGPGEVAPGVRLLDKGLLTRVAAVAKHFPGRPISVVSGYRPTSRGSLHQVGRALDLRVAGVSNEALVAFCRTLPDTGCGYYPNSSFVHVDVRSPGTGKVTWIDSSGPGEAPNYVRQWPLPAEESDGAVLPPDREPQDKVVDPWALDGGDARDEHAPRGDDAGSSSLPLVQ
jgi:hypothetical protein